MSRRQDVQSATGEALSLEPFGVYFKLSKAAPVGGEVGYATGCLWNVTGFTTDFNTGILYINIGNNGRGTNPKARWLEIDPSNAGQFQFGAGTATMLASGFLYKNSPATTTPASTAADIVVDVFTIPANSFDVANRSILVMAQGNKAANANTITAKIIINPTTAVIGSAVTGGTTIATTGATAAATGVGWLLEANVWKVGAAGSNTQQYQEIATIVGTTHGGMGTEAALTMTENAAIPVCVTINCATTATDASLQFWSVEGFN